MSAAWLIGGYGPDMAGTGRGIYRARTADSGALDSVELAAEAASPSFLAARGGHVYAAIEGAGRVESFQRADDNLDIHSLTRDGSAASGGTWPCHLGLLDDNIVAANFSNGTVGVVSLDAAGRVGELGQVVQDAGSGPRTEQDGPHAHATYLVDAGTLLGLDLGTDRIEVHAVTAAGLEHRASVALPPGTGPRDVARHPSGLLYVLGQLSGELHVFEWSGSELLPVSSVALPGVRVGDNASAISFGQGGHLYVGLRGSQRVAVLHASDDGRVVEPVAWVSSEGEWPRHLVVDSDLLHVANQLSNSVASFRLGADGIPRLIASVAVPSPTYLLKIS